MLLFVLHNSFCWATDSLLNDNLITTADHLVAEANNLSERIETQRDFVESLFSPEGFPPADFKCDVAPTSSMLDKVETPVFTPKKICTEPRASYKDGVLRVSTPCLLSTVRLDRATKQLKGYGRSPGPYPNPNWRRITGTQHLDSEFIRLKFPDGREARFAEARRRVWTRRFLRAPDESPSILLLVVDAMSRQAATWTFPRTMAYLKSKVKQKSAFVFNRFGSTGPNTRPNMTPILTGKPYPKRLWYAVGRSRQYTPVGIVDDDLLTTISRRNGYVTAYSTDNDDSMLFGCYWWNRSWFDHISPPHASIGYKNKCLGSFTNVQHQFHYIRTLWNAYDDSHPTFTYFHALHSHAGVFHRARVLDVDILELLRDAMSRGIVVAFIGDHGPSEWVGNGHGPLMNKLPLGSFLIPPDSTIPRDIIWNNQRRLVSQYDFYETFRSLMGGSAGGTPFGLNLFKDRIPRNRTCTQTGIPDERCLCSHFVKVVGKPAPRAIQTAIQNVLNIHGHAVAPNVCSRLLVKEIQQFYRRSGGTAWITFFFTNYGLHFRAASSDDGIQIRQMTRYKRFERCTPQNANPEFCYCL